MKLPKMDWSTDRKSLNTLKRIDIFLLKLAINKAKRNNDEYNLLILSNINKKKIHSGDRNFINIYLFQKIDEKWEELLKILKKEEKENE